MNFRLVKYSLVGLAASVLLLMGATTASAAPPANDNFSTAQVIGPALPISVPASTIEATSQAPTEPNIGGNAPISTIWFRWTAPANGQVVVNLCDSGFTGSEFSIERFAVWTGVALNALTEIETQVGECLLRFTAVAGTAYSIQVDYGATQGNFTFRMRQLTPPANDSLAGATVIGPGLPVNLPSTNLDSTHQAGEPPFLGGASSSRSVWYRWTAPATGQVRIDVCDFQSITGAANKALGVYTGAAFPLVPVVTTNYCELSFNAISGTTYQLAFSGYISGEGNYTFRLKNAPPPANDNFASAQVVGPQLPVKLQASNEFSTIQAGEPGHGGIGGPSGYSSWYNWTPAQNARVRIKSCGREFKARLGVYTGLAVGALTPVGESPPYAPHCSKLLNAVAGTTYRIATAGAPQEGEYGIYELDIHVLAEPANDDFADAQTFPSALPSSITGSTIDGSYESGEPNHYEVSGDPSASVWYRWTATSDDAIILSACSEGEPVRLAVYSGSALEQLDRIDQADEGCRGGLKGGRLAIAPEAGATYMIAVAAAERDYESNFTLTSTGPPVTPPVVTPPKAQFNLKQAIKKCKKIKSKKKSNACIKKARKKAAIIQCRKIVNPGKEAKCIRKARRTFR